MPDNEFAKHIDGLREARNISREDFVEGVISLRQYYRFVNGESSLKNDTLTELLQKLSFNSVIEFFNYLTSDNKMYSELSDAYYEITRHNLKESHEKLIRIDKSKLNTPANKKFYRLIELEVDFLQKKKPADLLIKEISELIDYPKILEIELLSFVESAALVLLNHLIVKKHDDFTITNFLYEKIKNNDIVHKTYDKRIIITFHSICARYMGKKGDFEKSMELCKLGIALSKKSYTYNSLANLYTYKALGEKESGQNHLIKSTLTDLFTVLKLEGNQEKSKMFKEQIYKLFTYNESDLIEYK